MVAQVWSLAGGTLSLQGRFTVPDSGLQLPIMRTMAFVAPTAGTAPILAVLGSTGSPLSLWDVSTNTPVMVGSQTFSAGGNVRTFGVTPAGALMLGFGGDLKFYELSALTAAGIPEPFLTLPGALSNGAYANASLSADGRWLSLAQSDGKIVVWDLKTKEAIGTSFDWLPSPTTLKPDDTFMAPDGSYVVSSSDSAVVVWDLDTNHWAKKVCFAAGRNLTETEWAKYFPGRDYAVTCDQWPAKPKI